MVIISPFFDFGENFVQPSETDHPKPVQNPILGSDRGQKAAFFALFRAKICFFAYEYAKTSKMPFPQRPKILLKTLDTR